MTTSVLPFLQPLSLAELLDKAIRLYRKNFLTFVGIIGVVQVPIQVISVLISILTFGDTLSRLRPGAPPPTNPLAIFSPSYFIGIGLSLLTTLIYLLLVNGFATAAITRAIADSYLGQPIGILQSYRRIGGISLKLVASLILASIVAVAIGLWAIIPCVGWISGPGLLAFYVGAVMPLIAPAIVLENQGVGGAIRRGWDLTRRRFWWVVGFVAVLFIFGQVVITGPTTLMSFLMQAIFGNPALASDPRAVFTLETIISSIVGLVFSLIYVPFRIVNVTMMYFDLRVRTEGLDLALQANTGTADQPDAPQLVAQAPRPDSSRLITMREIGYFILLTIGAVVAYLALVSLLGAVGIAMMAATGGFPPRP